MYLVEVAFKGNRREFFQWAGEDPPAQRAPVIVEADRGEDLGVVHSAGELAARRFAGVSHGEMAGPVEKRIVRLATPEEYEEEHRLRHEDDEAARRQAMARVREHGLSMKMSDAEWQWDRKKLTLYFTAERRVDFRALVRDLASTFRTRIELKQIGVRDEARRLDGIGRCGRQYCSASFLPELRPVNLGVAKDQGLSLNPLQISGACGRLMCCLRFEHDFYVQSRKRFPKEGRIITTARGEEKVVANDIFNDRVTLRNVEGDVRVVPLAELKTEIGKAGGSVGTRAPGERSPEEGTADAATVGEPAAGGSSRAGARRRSLPVRDASPPPPTTRPARRAAAPPEAPAGDAGDDAGDGKEVELATAADSRPPRPTPPRPIGEISSAPAAGSRSTADPDAGITTDAGTLAATGITVHDGGPAAEDGADDASDDSRRRRRRGRRGGRRGRSARDATEHATGSGNGAPGAGADDRGE